MTQLTVHFSAAVAAVGSRSVRMSRNGSVGFMGFPPDWALGPQRRGNAARIAGRRSGNSADDRSCLVVGTRTLWRGRCQVVGAGMSTKATQANGGLKWARAKVRRNIDGCRAPG